MIDYRDFSPNVDLTRRPVVKKVIDFGVALGVLLEGHMRRREFIAGTA